MYKSASNKSEIYNETTNTILSTLKSLKNNNWESHYTNVEKIASGGNATVFKANRCKTCTSLQPSTDDLEVGNSHNNDTKNSPTAIKKSRSINTQKLLSSDFLTEINTLKKFSHKNIIQFFNAWIQEKLEKPRKSSEDLLKKNNNNNLEDTQNDTLSTTYCPYNTNLSSHNQQDTTLEEEFSPLINKRRKLSSSPMKIRPAVAAANNKCIKLLDVNNNSKTNSSNPTSIKLNLAISQGYQDAILTMPKRVYGFIETELCQDNLNEYIQARNKQFFKQTCSEDQKKQYTKEALQISQQILDALQYMHQVHQTAHLDLKPQNIFLNYHNNNILVKLGDFGSAKTFEHFQEQIKSKKGKSLPYTQMYASPEFLALRNNKLSKNQTVQAQQYDLFSLGVLLLELFIPVSTSMELIGLLKTYKEKKISISEEEQQQDNCLIPELRDLLQQLLSIQPSNRPELNQIISKLTTLTTTIITNTTSQEQEVTEFFPYESEEQTTEKKEEEKQLQITELELINEKLGSELTSSLFAKQQQPLLRSQLSELSAASTQLSENGFYQTESTQCIVNNLEKVLDAQAFDREDLQNTGSNIF